MDNREWQLTNQDICLNGSYTTTTISTANVSDLGSWSNWTVFEPGVLSGTTVGAVEISDEELERFIDTPITYNTLRPDTAEYRWEYMGQPVRVNIYPRGSDPIFDMTVKDFAYKKLWEEKIDPTPVIEFLEGIKTKED